MPSKETVKIITQAAALNYDFARKILNIPSPIASNIQKRPSNHTNNAIMLIE